MNDQVPAVRSSVVSVSTPASSPVLRFLDAFLQEKNIKWLLGVGSLLVLGSSLRLVAAHWREYPPVWKYLVLIGYTGATWAAGELALRRLSLPKTGGGLMALTVLLFPISFLALHWVQPAGCDWLAYLTSHLPLAALLIGNSVACAFAARRIFDHFLRGPQPTFLASYLLLGIAGAIMPALPGSWLPAAGLALWATLTAGIVKVNRRVFWMVEEHRLPRICGFFPIALLVAEFLALAAINLPRYYPQYLPLPWLGLAMVLAAIPVLLTADAVARVAEQRTGGLLRPLPWSVGLPFSVGLALVIGGVCLAGAPRPVSLALPPTAALAAIALGVLAQRTRKTALVWATIASAVVAYNFSPLWFQGIARMTVEHGAAAVRESRLPYPFYGLTYLPLLAALAVASRTAGRRGLEVFEQPLRQAAAGLGLLLLGVGCGHPKALAPVGLAMSAMFAWQTGLFRDRRLMAPAAAGLTIGGLGWTAFAHDVLRLPVSSQTLYLSLAVVSALLLVSGRWLDAIAPPLTAEHNPWLVRWFGPRPRICQSASALVAACAAIGLFVALPAAFPYTAICALCLLLIANALVRPMPGLGELALAAPAAFGLAWMARSCETIDSFKAATAIGLSYWLLSYLDAWPASRVSRAFARPARRLSLVAMSALGLACVAPGLVLANLAPEFRIVDLSLWAIALATIAWSFDAARRLGNYSLASLGATGALALASAAASNVWGHAAALVWFPAIWSGVSIAALPWTLRQIRKLWIIAHAWSGDGPAPRSFLDAQRRLALVEPIYAIATGVLSMSALGSLLALGAPARVAGALGVVGLWFVWRRERCAEFCRVAPLLIANWQLLAFVVQLSVARAHTPASDWLARLTPLEVLSLAIPLALAAAASRAAFEAPRWLGADVSSAVAQAHRGCLSLLAGLALFYSTLLGSLTAVEIGMAGCAFAILAGCELWAASRDHAVGRVWLAEAIVAAAVAYFAAFDVIRFGLPWGAYALWLAGVLTWALGWVAARHPRTAVMAGPFAATGMLLPLGSVVLGVGRHVLEPGGTWLGNDSLALLLAAAFYFWRGMEQAQPRLIAVAAAIVNVALVLLWRELSWTDPQWFMVPAGATVLLLVELLKREIPDALRNPLRYVGALVILVSPTFHIASGSWLHMFTLMVAAVAIVLLAIGLRVRALMYAGTAFLVADLAAILVRSSIDRPNLLWLMGVALGAAVIAVAAVCENHRETLLQRLRVLAADIGRWE